MPKKAVTKKKIKALKQESYLDKNGFVCWRYLNVPKELIPTENDIGKLVKVAREPGTRDARTGYRIRSINQNNGDTIINLLSNDGYASYRIDSIVLSNDKLTKDEKLAAIHEGKGKEKNDRDKRTT